MPRGIEKRKSASKDSGDEMPPTRQKKTQRTRNTVKFADTVQATSSTKQTLPQKLPKSILKKKTIPSPPSPASPDRALSPSPEQSEQPQKEDVDTIEAERMSILAAAAAKMVKTARKEEQKQEMAAAQKELALTKNNLENIQICVRDYVQARDKATRASEDANKRAEVARSDLQKALLDNGKLENKLRTMEGQMEKLQRELDIAREEKSEMEKLLHPKMAKDREEADDRVAK